MLNKAAAFVVALALLAALGWAVSLRFRPSPGVDFATGDKAAPTASRPGSAEAPLSAVPMETPPLAGREKVASDQYRALVEGQGRTKAPPAPRKAAPAAPVAAKSPEEEALPSAEDLDQALEAAQGISKAEEIRQQYMAGLDRRYGTLFEKMGLNESEVEELKGLLADRHQAGMAAAGPSGGGQGEGSSETVEQAAERIREYLGDDLFAMFQEFEGGQAKKGPASSGVGEIMERRGKPLTPEQEQALSQAMAEAKKELSEAGGQITGGQLPSLREKMADRAAEILDPDQAAAFLESLDRMSVPAAGGASPPTETAAPPEP